ncbi:hypothetical protein ABZ371_11830 [Streptomyces sp. NPDC005899]|uniref:hypothetical protein n=1 Tax=Streptomyces sp. NPDC005899 TaxID=3155716 RepID=UPI003411B168
MFTALAPLLIACGAGLEGRHQGSPPQEWISRRNGAIGFLGMQFALTLVVGLLYALMIGRRLGRPVVQGPPFIAAGHHPG